MKREIQLPFLCLPIEIVKVKAREILYRQNCIITCSRKLSANKVHNLYKAGNVAENYVEVQGPHKFFPIQGVRTRSNFF